MELIGLKRSIKDALSERVALETTLLRLARSRDRVAIEDLVRKCAELERSLAGGAAAVPAGPSASAPPPVAGPGDDPPAGLERVRKIWPEFLETLGHEKPLLKTYLHEGRLQGLENGVLTVCFDPEYAFQRESLDSPNKIAYLENLLKNKLGAAVKLKLTIGAAPSGCARGPAEPPPGPAKKKLIKGNPMVKAAIEIFDATVVDIKE